MKKPALFFAIKCSIILYFAACTSIEKITDTIAASPRVTRGVWKINTYTEAKKDNTAVFDGLMLTFQNNGKIVAYKNGEKVLGNWAEDDILKRLTISLDTKDPVLEKLNNYWKLSTVSKWNLSFENTEGRHLEITSL
jgi:hypothetical protein